MSNPLDEPTFAAAQALRNVFDQLGVTGVVIGGVAVSLVARERYTDDLDAMLIYDTADASHLLQVAQKFGFEPRFPGMEDLARNARMVPLKHVPTGTVVDIALGTMLFEEELVRR